MNSIRTRIVGVLVGCGLMAATPFLSGALGQGIQPDDGIWCAEHHPTYCKICKQCQPVSPGVWGCGTVVVFWTCPEGYTPVCMLGGGTGYTTRCDAPAGS